MIIIFLKVKKQSAIKNSRYMILFRRNIRLLNNREEQKGQITGILQEDLDRYMEQLMEKYHVTDQEDGRKNLLKIINANVYYAVEEVIQFAEVRLERKLSGRGGPRLE